MRITKLMATAAVVTVMATVVPMPGVAVAGPYWHPPVLGPAAANCYAVPGYHQGVLGLWAIGGTCRFTQGVIAEFGNSRLILQTDGNLVIYAIDSGRAAWSTNTQGRGGVKAAFEVDGTLMILRANNTVVWFTFTWTICNNHYQYPYLTFQQDGNLVVYCRYADGTGAWAIWATNTRIG